MPAEYTRLFGCPELHAVHYQHHQDRGGPSHAVLVSIPGPPRQAVRRALAIARRQRSRVAFVCDTHDRAQRMHELACRLLPEHRFVSLERADAGAWRMDA
jgi:sugar/nucleoside kinase (ribokinase family)